MPAPGIVIENLNEFRKALRDSDDATPRELTKALKDAAEPILTFATAITVRRTGHLSSGWQARVAGTKGRILNREPYGGGAVWGARGKWSGFLRYGGPGRFAAKALDEKADEVADRIIDSMREIVELHGWAR